MPIEQRIAFFISSYRAPLQLNRLVRTLRAAEPRSPIVVLHNPYETPLDSWILSDVPDVHVFLSEHPIHWGDFSLDRARLKIFRWILDNLEVDWVVLLSEQDYPIAPLSRLRTRLATEGADAYVKGHPILDTEDRADRRHFQKRYMYQYISLPSMGIDSRLPMWARRASAAIRKALFLCVNYAQPLLSICMMPVDVQLPSVIGMRSRRHPFSVSFPCWYYDAWYVVSNQAVRHIVAFVDSHPEIVHYYERTFIPIESMVGTIVCNDPDLRVVNDNLHEIRWHASAHPDVFGSGDLEILRASTAVFARKFDLDRADILDELDRIVLSGSPGAGEIGDGD